MRSGAPRRSWRRRATRSPLFSPAAATIPATGPASKSSPMRGGSPPAIPRSCSPSKPPRKRPPGLPAPMPPDPAAATLLLRDGVIMLGAALGFVMLFRRFGLGAVLGYLVAGALIGPEGLRLINAPEEMLHIADFGIVLLLFLVGLELHPERLWRLKRDIFGLGFAQVVITGLALALLVRFGAGFSWP